MFTGVYSQASKRLRHAPPVNDVIYLGKRQEHSRPVTTRPCKWTLVKHRYFKLYIWLRRILPLKHLYQ